MVKKGELTLKGVVELTVAAAAIFVLVMIAVGFGTEDFFLRAKMVRDGAASVDAFYAIPGNSWLRFQPSFSQYAFDLKQGKTEVSADPAPLFQWFTGTVVPAQLTNAPNIYFYKDGPTISISSNEPEPKKFACGDITYKPKNVKMRVTKETAKIAQFFFGTSKSPCSQENLCAASADKLKEEADMFIKLVSMKQGGVAVRYPRSSLESRQLACAFANNLIAKGVNIWLLPTDDTEITPRGLLIEIGGEHSNLVAQLLEAALK